MRSSNIVGFGWYEIQTGFPAAQQVKSTVGYDVHLPGCNSVQALESKSLRELKWCAKKAVYIIVNKQVKYWHEIGLTLPHSDRFSG